MMALTIDSVSKGIAQMRERSEKRKFEQSVEISITISGIDLKKPESRITLDVLLPHGAGEQKTVAVFGEGEFGRLARNSGADLVMDRSELDSMQGDKKKAKKIADTYDHTIAQTDFMVMIGKILGPVLGPRGRMPKPIPPTANPAPLIEKMRKTVRVTARSQLGLQAKIGKETMPDDQLAANAMAVIEEVERKVGDLGGSVEEIYFKTTMGKPVKLKVS